ncbi:Glycine cleavage system H protein [Candidatus Lokiarchaeum ossiferum]|uniref:Probable glycine cleavage system H protein n=1 Tax=Candidatus Lokiarchaeum ossiferum TaxID=2951803 RepID=A0ABY6HRU6_9ARCH|nr:Glycine cleavage system H protein [Candidatus Lokiarchaeum sp. B-35]
MVNIPEDLKYAETHEWVKVEGDIAIVGISDHAQDQLGEIVFAELPEVGDNATAGEGICNLESAKAVGEIKAPISGEVIEVNEDLDDEPEKVNSDCYGEGFLYKCKIADAGELDKLLDAAAYKGTL